MTESTDNNQSPKHPITSNQAKQNAEQPPTTNLMEKFITLQEKELIIRGQELELRKQNDSNAHDYAQAALSANVKDRDAERTHNSTVLKYGYFFAAFVILLLMILFGVALYFGKDQLVMEIIKAIVYVGAGSIGGYAYGKVKKPQE